MTSQAAEKKPWEKNYVFFLIFAGLTAWIIPGLGYLLFNDKKRAAIVFAFVTATFIAGIYAGSIGVVDPDVSKAWFMTQIMTSPLVGFIPSHTAAGIYAVNGRPYEVGQIYTSIAGLLNLLCIVNVVYSAHLKSVGKNGESE